MSVLWGTVCLGVVVEPYSIQDASLGIAGFGVRNGAVRKSIRMLDCSPRDLS